MKRITIVTQAAAALLAGWALLSLAACSDEPAEGRIVLELTDAPFPFDLVQSTEVTVDSVKVRLVGGSGFHTVDRTSRVIDLLELHNGVTASLGEAMIPVGEIDQVRVYTGEATVTLGDDRTFELKFPSGSSGGVKVIPSPPIEIQEDQTVQALIDFDLGSSFSSVPASPTKVDEISSFRFHPVLRVSNLEDVGAVSGTVFSDEGTPGDPDDDVPLVDANVTAWQGTTEVTSTSSGADGRWVILGLSPGEYDIVASVSDGFEPDTIAVSVEAAVESIGIDFILRATP